MLTLIHLTETANILFVDCYWKSAKVEFEVH